MLSETPRTPHSLEAEKLCQLLEIDPSQGLSAATAASRLKTFGPNELTQKSKISALTIFLNQFRDIMVIILMAAIVVALGTWYLEGGHGFPTDAVVIAAIVVANAILGFLQEYRAEKTLEALARSAEVQSKVLRDGVVVALEHGQIVPGDIVLLSEGDRVPSDGYLLRVSSLFCDESPLTGESVPVAKSLGVLAEDAPLADRHNSVFAGTTVTSGEAKAVVVATGDNTELGGIATSLAETVSEETPLQRRLNQLGGQIGWGIAVITVLIAITVLLAEGQTDQATLLRVAMFSVALAVAAVPEGLPAVLTISLSEGAKRLAQLKAIARKMPAVETLGSVTRILTDKTGTLTYNQMTVTALQVGQARLSIGGVGYESSETFTPESDAVRALVRCGMLAGRADLEEKDGQRQAVGDPMDAALLVLAEKAGMDWRQVRSSSSQMGEIPFSSDRARVSLVWKAEDKLELFCKGSFETVVERSTRRLAENGELVPLSQDEIDAYAEAVSEFGERGWRTLALAYRPVEALEEDLELLECELIFLGLAAFSDPPRETVPEALRRCREAGIEVAMVTGDHPGTAAAIARDIGLIRTPATLTGRELATLEPEAVQDASREYHVFARVSPSQKLLLAESLIDQGEVVAMTGDGVNDAPVLRKVHVGLAMGRAGTAVAVEASDIVLLEDDFATIVDAIREGRSIFANVQRFITFLFSGNFGVVTAMFLGTVLAGWFNIRYEGELLLPLVAAQILWMNLVTDGAPAVAFALGPSDETLMNDPPRDPSSPILTPRLWQMVVVTGCTLAGLFLLILDWLYIDGFFTWSLEAHDHQFARSAAFYTLVTARLLNALNFLHLERSLFDPVSWKNRAVPVACLFSWALTLILFYVPSFATVFGLSALPLPTLALLSLVVCPLVFLPAEFYKALVARRF